MGIFLFGTDLGVLFLRYIRKGRLGEGGRRNYLEGKERTVHRDFEKKKKKHKGAGSQAIAAKTAQVRFQLFPMLYLIRFLMILRWFWAFILLISVDGKGHKLLC